MRWTVFHDIPEPMRRRMAELERIDARDRADGTPKERRLRQIPAETGRFLAILAAGSPAGSILEVGTSGGYSTLWLALAARETGRRVTTFEILPNKALLARETFRVSGIEGLVELVEGDAVARLIGLEGVGFAFVDVEKGLYRDCFEAIVPNLVSGGLMCADNVVSHAEELAGFLRRVEGDPRVDSVVVPIGKGVSVCRKR